MSSTALRIAGAIAVAEAAVVGTGLAVAHAETFIAGMAGNSSAFAA